MGKILVFFFLSFVPTLEQLLGAQPDNRSVARIKSYAVLPDAGYSFTKVRTDLTLPFIANDSLRPALRSYYWLRLVVVNPGYYDESCVLSIEPNLNSTTYYFDGNSRHWLSHQAGIDVPYSGRRNRADNLVVAKGSAQTIVYLKVDVHRLHLFDKAIKPRILLEKQSLVAGYEQFMLITWIASLSVLFLFFLNNLIIYVSFRDKLVLYYLIVQIGGMIYITFYKQFLQILLPSPVFTLGIYPDGSVYYFNLESLVQHISILLILYGFVQLARAYLRMATTLPRFDFFLKYGLYSYLLVCLFVMVINVFFVCLNNYTLIVQNIHVFLLTAGTLCACIVGYVRKLPASGPFLLANSLPLAFIITIPLFHLLVSMYASEQSLIPDLAVVSQALAFSIALVARTKFIQTELTARTVETQQLAFDMREIELKHQLAELENQTITAAIWHEKTRNELLQERLDVNQRELASTTMYIVQKNELLAGLRSQLTKLNKQNPPGWHQDLKGIESILRSNLYLDADWGKFKVHFEQVHPNFFDDLLARHPSLTKHEIRLYAYFHINLSTKEIAALLNIDPASVRRAKTRLYKKMAIPVPGNPLD